jgi:hypothetical protein
MGNSNAKVQPEYIGDSEEYFIRLLNERVSEYCAHLQYIFINKTYHNTPITQDAIEKEKQLKDAYICAKQRAYAYRCKIHPSVLPRYNSHIEEAKQVFRKFHDRFLGLNHHHP